MNWTGSFPGSQLFRIPTPASPSSIGLNRAFGANESGKVRVGKTNVVVHCLEIRDGSVIIEVDGSQEKQELSLKVK